jgi:hypothetical protein
VPNRNFIRLPNRKHTAVFKKGGHVAALHEHLNNALFFRIDIQNFYYSIARMRVTRALRDWRYPGAGTFAKWSCVVNPGPGPKFSFLSASYNHRCLQASC